MEVFSHHLLSDTICGKMKKKIVRSKKFFFSSYFLFKMVELFWRNRHECVFPFFVYILLCLILSSKRFLTAFKNSLSLFAHKFSLCSSHNWLEMEKSTSEFNFQCHYPSIFAILFLQFISKMKNLGGEIFYCYKQILCTLLDF